VGTKDGGVEIDGFKDGGVEGREEAVGLMDGADDNVGIEDGREVGLMDGTDDDDGINEIDGDAEGTRGSQSISILSASKYSSQGTYILGFSP